MSDEPNNDNSYGLWQINREWPKKEEWPPFDWEKVQKALDKQLQDALSKEVSMNYPPEPGLTLQDIIDAKEMIEKQSLAADPSKWVQRIECPPEEYILLRGFLDNIVDNVGIHPGTAPLFGIPIVERDDITRSRAVYRDGHTEEI